MEEDIETLKSSKSIKSSSKMTLQKAVDMGEYNPDFLSTFPEWHTFSKHIQFQYVRQAIENRRKQLVVQYAEICNILDFSKKPHLKEALKNIKEQLDKVEDDREDLFVEFSK